MSAPASPSKTQTPGPVKTSNPAKPSNPARAARRAMWAGWLEPVTTMMETRSPPLDRQALAAQLASLPPRAKNQKKWQVGFLAVVKQALQEGAPSWPKILPSTGTGLSMWVAMPG